MRDRAMEPRTRATGPTSQREKLPGLRELWSMPSHSVVETRPIYANSTTPFTHESPPASSSFDPRDSLSRSQSASSTTNGAMGAGAHAERSWKGKPPKKTLARQKHRRASSGGNRGTGLRDNKRPHWRNLERNLERCGGLKLGKPLHVGNQKVAGHWAQELTILAEMDDLLEYILQDEQCAAVIREFMRKRASGVNVRRPIDRGDWSDDDMEDWVTS